MPRAFASIILSLLSLLCSSQLVEVNHELFYEDDGSIPGYPLGFATWRIYADLEDPADFLVAVYANSNDELILGSNTSNNFNHALGGITGDQLNALLFGVFPNYEYDSFVTIGRASSADPGGFISAFSTLPNDSLFQTHFDTGGPVDEFDANLEMQDGAWFTPIGNVNGYGIDQGGPGPYRVLLAQVTTNGILEYRLNIQMHDEGESDNALYYVGACGGADGEEIEGSCLGLSTYTEDILCCVNDIAGCTDYCACSYNPQATIDDGSCYYGLVNDCCSGSLAIEPGEYLISNVGACDLYWFTSQGSCAEDNDFFTAALWYAITIEQDSAQVNIYTNDDGSSTWTNTQLSLFESCNGPEIICDQDDDQDTGLGGGGQYAAMSVCLTEGTYYLQVDGYDADDGSCMLTYEIVSDGDCWSWGGCVDPEACNFNALATYDDGSCVVPPCFFWPDLDGDGFVSIEDLLDLLGNLGCTAPPDCEGDLNQDGIVNIFDLLEILGWFGQEYP